MIVCNNRRTKCVCSAAHNGSVTAEFRRERLANKLLKLDKPTRTPTTSKVRRCFGYADTSTGIGYFVELAVDATARRKERTELEEVKATAARQRRLPEPKWRRIGSCR